LGLTRGEADRLVSLPKTIGELITWQPVRNDPNRHRFDVAVASSHRDGPLRLTGTANRTNWSFVLLKGATPIRKLTVHGGGHINPDGADAGQRHKHTWDEHDEDRNTYFPTDVDFSDIDQALIDFLRECSIDPLAGTLPLLTQGRLR
jgi:hypothetical protein